MDTLMRYLTEGTLASNLVNIVEIEPPDEIEEINTFKPCRAEIKETIKHLKNGKAQGIDKI